MRYSGWRVFAEALRGLMFDEKLQERAGSSIVQFRLERLTGTHVTIPASKDKDPRERAGPKEVEHIAIVGPRHVDAAETDVNPAHKAEDEEHGGSTNL